MCDEGDLLEDCPISGLLVKKARDETFQLLSTLTDLSASSRLEANRNSFLWLNNIGQLLLACRDGDGMVLTGWNHAPFILRHRIGDGDRSLSITVVVDTREGWMNRDLSKVLIHSIIIPHFRGKIVVNTTC